MGVDVLAVLSKARTDLAKVDTVAAAKDIRDKAEALRTYCKQAGEGLATQNRVAEIKILAECRAGELLADTVRHEGGRPSKRLQPATVSLQQLGIEKTPQNRSAGGSGQARALRHYLC
jgi:hypothetical protein